MLGVNPYSSLMMIDHHLGHVLELTAGWMYGYPEAASQDIIDLT